MAFFIAGNSMEYTSKRGDWIVTGCGFDSS